MAAETTTGKSTGFILRYNPMTTTFREYDKKFMVLRPDIEDWYTVLTEEDPWDQMTEADPTVPLYTAEQIVKLKKADRTAISQYVLGNSGSNDAYTNGQSAYKIRMALRARYAPVDGIGLAELQQRYNEVISKQPYACPDIWVNDLDYYSRQMAEAGGTIKSNADIIAHLITSIPKIYEPVITLITSKPITTSGLLAETQILLRNFWVRNIKDKYTTTQAVHNKKHHEAYAYSTTAIPENPPSAMSPQKPWKKYKGNCRHCGKQGHRMENCFTRLREEGKPTPNIMGEEKQTYGIKCYNCNKIGHIARYCTEPKKMNNQTEPFVGHYGVEDDFFDNFSNNGSDAEDDVPAQTADGMQTMIFQMDDDEPNETIDSTTENEGKEPYLMIDLTSDTEDEEVYHLEMDDNNSLKYTGKTHNRTTSDNSNEEISNNNKKLKISYYSRTSVETAPSSETTGYSNLGSTDNLHPLLAPTVSNDDNINLQIGELEYNNNYMNNEGKNSNLATSNNDEVSGNEADSATTNESPENEMSPSSYDDDSKTDNSEQYHEHDDQIIGYNDEYRYEESSNNEEEDSDDKTNESTDESFNDNDTTTSKESDVVILAIEQDIKELENLRWELPIYDIKQHPMLNHVAFINEKKEKKLIVNRDIMKSMSTSLNSEDENNKISSIVNNHPRERTMYVQDENMLGRTTSEFADNPAYFTTGNINETLHELIERDRTHAYLHNAKEIMDKLTYYKGYNPIDSYTVPNWIALKHQLTSEHFQELTLRNPTDITYWHCAKCGYFKPHVPIVPVPTEEILDEENSSTTTSTESKGDGPVCESCKHLKELYRKDVNYHGKYLGQCQRCNELGPAATVCTNCFKLSQEEIN